MILFDIVGENEADPVYQAVEVANISRQYDFLRSIVSASLAVDKCFLSTTVLKALNYHAITCLHTNAGEFRPCQVQVGNHTPPAHFRLQALMDDFINDVNRNWDRADPVVLAAFVLWRLNFIHPFINGNGRTARAACYFVLCLKAGGHIRGTKILPEIIRRERARYVEALQGVDKSYSDGNLDLSPLHGLLSELISEQLQSAEEGQPPEEAPAH